MRRKKTKNTPDDHRYSKKVRVIALLCAIVLIIGGFACVGIGSMGTYLLSLIRFDTGEVTSMPKLPPDVDDGTVTKKIDDPNAIADDVSSIALRGNTDTITNVLLVGIDGRTGEGYAARSDTNMILTIDDGNRQVKLSSLLRDLWVTLPGVDENGDGLDDYDKLNAAFYYGGFSLLSSTIEQNFRLDIQKYVAVDFDAFKVAVDAMGGIDVELTAEEAQFIPVESNDPDRFATEDNPDLTSLGQEAGVYHLNGQQTLAFSRIRYLYASSDFKRQSNQRKVINLILEKAKSMNFASLTWVLTQVLPYVQTNMSKDELLAYASNVFKYADYAIYNDYALPHGDDFEDTWIGDGLGLWLTDQEKSVLELHQYIYLPHAEINDDPNA